MFIIIDNYDSFVHNLARYCAIANVQTRIIRNDAVTLDDLRAMNPEAIVLSPGPCTPAEAGICVEAIRTLGADIPVFGVCLGHQCIGAAYGHDIIRAKEPMHGKARLVCHDGHPVFESLPSPFFAGRYHSLIVAEKENSPLHITARDDEGQIMAMAHPENPVYGVQFHPESILTQHGQRIVNNFVKIASEWNEASKKKAA